jgi:putative spermidine/putrescine transport system permease protein
VTASRPGPVALALGALVALFLLMPLLAVVPISFTPARFLSMPKGTLSLVHYRALIEDPAWMGGFLLSLRIGIVSSVIATALATAFSLGIWMARPRFTAVLVGFVLLPMIVPPVVSAMTLYFLLTLLSQLSSTVGYDTWLGVVLAHVVMIVPFAVVMILVALAGVDRRFRRLGRPPRLPRHPAEHQVRHPHRPASYLRHVLGGDRRDAVRHLGRRHHPTAADVDGRARQH